ncbi:MAG: metallophosphoesterase [Pseudomonadota bacterium]
MTTLRIVQITDTHLSQDFPQFWPNFDRIVANVNDEAPHLVINTGDIACNGPDSDAELEFAARRHRAINAPFLAVPGNHDIGEEPPGQPAKQYIDAPRRSRWHRYFGHDWWAIGFGAWRIIGINSQLMGSGIEAEELQWAWLEQELAEAADRPVAIFQHKPPFREDPHRPASFDDFRCMTAAARERYAALIAPSSVRFISCGHSHIHRKTRWLDKDVYWAPPASAVEDAATGPNGHPGYARFDFTGSDVRIRFVFPLECDLIDFNDMHAGAL